MQSTILLLKDKNLHLRLQAPVLTAGACNAHGRAQQNGESVIWKATAGEVILSGCCTRVHDTLWHMEFTLENRGHDAEVSLSLPYIFYHFEAEEPARVFNPKFGGVLEASTVPICISYPGPASFCMTAATVPGQALAVGLYNTDQRHALIRHIPAGKDGQIRFVLDRIWVGAGKREKLPAHFISLGEDWGDAMKPYREWFTHSFSRPRSRPDWWIREPFTETRKAHCLAPYNPHEAAAGVWIFDNEGEPRTFEQLKAEVDEAVADGISKGYKPLFYQFGWWQSMADIKGLFMFDSLCGDYTEAHNTTKKVIDYIHACGMRTYLYTNAISAGDETEVYKNHPDLFAHDRGGLPVYNESYPMLMFCPGSPGIRTYWEEVISYILKDLNADGLFLDQICGGTPPPYCYDPAHAHAHPDTYGKDILGLINHICDFARSIKSDCFIAGELMLDTRAILLDEAHGYGYSGPTRNFALTAETLGDGAQALSAPAEYYIFTKYLCPEVYSQRTQGAEGVMNGGGGQHKDFWWQAYREIFEGGCIPLKTDSTQSLAYLFGPSGGNAILAVRCVTPASVRIRLPVGLEGYQLIGAEIEEDVTGGYLCDAEPHPRFICVMCKKN